MDGLTVLAWSLLGATAGLLTGLVPGLHVNTLAAVGLALLPGPHAAPAAVALVAVGVAHTFVTILPATYLGVPGDDAPGAVLPAHRLLKQGRAPDAIHASVHASLLGLLGAVVLLLPLRWLLGEPGRLLPHLDHAAPWLLGATLVALLIQDRHRLAASATTMALAAWLGLQAFAWPVAGLLPLPATPLLPLLSGLYGVPGLAHGLHARARVPLQDDAPPWHAPGARGRDVAPGILVSAATAILPGLTSAVATSIARAGRRDPEPLPVLATLSTVNTTHAVLALGMLWLIGRTRSGLAQAVDALAPVAPWPPGPAPPLLGAVVQAVLVAGVVGAAGTLWLERPVRLGLERLPARAPSILGLAAVLALTTIITGPRGLLLLAVSAVVGTVPLALGTRRTPLAAALIVPILWRLTT